MKEYRVRFNKRPGGPEDGAYLIELEDETGKSLGGTGTPYKWKDEGNSVVLVLPTYEERFKKCRTALSNAKNTIEWLLGEIYDPKQTLEEILAEVEEALEGVKET